MYSRISAAGDGENLIENDVEVFEASLDELEREALERSLARNTNRAYKGDWKDFTDWCVDHAANPLPADARTLERYMLDRSQSLSKATLERRIASISRYHKEGGHVSPTTDYGFRKVMSGIRKKKIEPQRHQHRTTRSSAAPGWLWCGPAALRDCCPR